MQYLVLGIAALLGLYFYKQKEAAGHLIFFPGNIVDMGFAGSSPVASLTIQVQNTSNAGIDLNSIAGSVYANGILVGNVSNFNPVHIAGNSQTLIPLTVQFNLLGVVNDIIRAFQTGSFRQDIMIDGYVNAGSFQVPVQLKFNVG